MDHRDLLRELTTASNGPSFDNNPPIGFRFVDPDVDDFDAHLPHMICDVAGTWTPASEIPSGLARNRPAAVPRSAPPHPGDGWRFIDPFTENVNKKPYTEHFTGGEWKRLNLPPRLQVMHGWVFGIPYRIRC